MGKKDKMVELLGMELHDEGVINDEFWVLRVPGGWVYTYLGAGSSSVFVPEPVLK